MIKYDCITGRWEEDGVVHSRGNCERTDQHDPHVLTRSRYAGWSGIGQVAIERVICSGGRVDIEIIVFPIPLAGDIVTIRKL